MEILFLTSAVTLLPLGSPSTSSHQIQKLCLQLFIIPPVIHPPVGGQVQQQPHLSHSEADGGQITPVVDVSPSTHRIITHMTDVTCLARAAP